MVDDKDFFQIKEDTAVTRHNVHNLQTTLNGVLRAVEQQNGRVRVLETAILPLTDVPSRLDRLESEHDKNYWPRKAWAIILTFMLTSGVGILLGLQVAQR